MPPVYLAATTTRLAPLFDPMFAIDGLYPPTADNGLANRLARKAARAVGIRHRPSVLDPARYPERALARAEDDPVAWCTSMTQELAEKVGSEAVGFLSVAYNISSNPDVLPSVSARVATQSRLDLDRPADERAFYGCAGALFSLENAVAYCQGSSRAAVVCTFDHCTWIVNAVPDVRLPGFSDHLRTSLIFGDGAAGLLLVPEALRSRVVGPLAKIVDVATDFVPGGSVRMEGGHLLLGKDIRDELPEIVATRLVRPMLERHGLSPDAIEEWSIHQGGLPILARFSEPQTLGLSAEKLRRSEELFRCYGNFSAPSCLFVLHSFFGESSSPRAGRRGVVLAFGAGYYFGALLYEWSTDV